ncbi:hypothetical protein RA210_U50128 [Rubrivivax sp. A210]|nr:hypothetical protein RA210_U50128 [Rubrivivax sp. A210]
MERNFYRSSRHLTLQEVCIQHCERVTDPRLQNCHTNCCRCQQMSKRLKLSSKLITSRRLKLTASQGDFIQFHRVSYCGQSKICYMERSFIVGQCSNSCAIPQYNCNLSGPLVPPL